MSDELRERVAAVIADVEYPRLPPRAEHYEMADAAIALCFEEAAKAAESVTTVEIDGYDFQVDGPSQYAIVDAIRALKDAPA